MSRQEWQFSRLRFFGQNFWTHFRRAIIHATISHPKLIASKTFVCLRQCTPETNSLPPIHQSDFSRSFESFYVWIYQYMYIIRSLWQIICMKPKYPHDSQWNSSETSHAEERIRNERHTRKIKYFYFYGARSHVNRNAIKLFLPENYGRRRVVWTEAPACYIFAVCAWKMEKRNERREKWTHTHTK